LDSLEKVENSKKKETKIISFSNWLLARKSHTKILQIVVYAEVAFNCKSVGQISFTKIIESPSCNSPVYESHVIFGAFGASNRISLFSPF